jgi:FtsP/CotA-like multicopper oxidase with cupredoxin domain
VKSAMVTRRQFLIHGSAGVGAASLPLLFGVPAKLRAESPPTELVVGSRVLDVHGQAATVYGITDTHGRSGLTVNQADGFHVRLRNALDLPTLVHWHGLTPPAQLDGVPGLSQNALNAGEGFEYHFPLLTSGTHWMHSHVGLQEQQLLAAPLIVRSSENESSDEQQVVLLLHDFSFKAPEEILSSLKTGAVSHIGSGLTAWLKGMVRSRMPEHSDSQMGQHGGMMHGMGTTDVNDVKYDAYLINDRDLSDPDVIQVDRGNLVRLRIINAAASSNFWIELGNLTGSLVAVDGMPVLPIQGRRFEIAMAQRLDLLVRIPTGDQAFPVLAVREGETDRTGVILQPSGSKISKLAAHADSASAPVLFDLERRLTAATPPTRRKMDRQLTCHLSGTMAGYEWGINNRRFEDREPLSVARGERVNLAIRNDTMMSHPMHLHGHHFQVVGISGARFNGAMRDTVLVPAMETVNIEFDANNPGEWAFHCHNLYHMVAGMMTSIKYV